MDILTSSENVYIHNDVEIKREYLIGKHVAYLGAMVEKGKVI